MFQVGGQNVNETLPAWSVDLHKEVVCSWGVLEEDPELLDMMVDGGEIPLVDLVPGKDPLVSTVVPKTFHWAKSKPDEFGIVEVLVDTPKIDETILMALFLYGVIAQS